jgi:hypothetical protein
MAHNSATTIYASAARTATPTAVPQTNHHGRGVLLVLDVTATPNNAETLTVAVQAKDPVSGKAVTLTAFAALTASSLGATPTTETYAYTVYPGAAETAAVSKHEVQALALPINWQATVTHSSTGSWTYSLAAYPIV